jgi:hypothetical protein
MSRQGESGGIGSGKHPNSLANLRMVQPGEIRNPSGRKSGWTLTTVIKNALMEQSKTTPDKTNADIIVETIIRECKKGNAVLIKEVLNRIDGAVKIESDVNVTGNNLGVIIIPNKDVEIEDVVEE